MRLEQYELKNDLNKKCPLGHLSTKHLSNTTGFPDRNLVTRSTQARVALLDHLAKRTIADQTPIDIVDIAEYRQFASRSRKFFENAPSCIEEVFPITESRCAEAILDQLVASQSPLARCLAAMYRFHSGLGVDHRSAMRGVIKSLEQNPSHFSKSHSDSTMSAIGYPVTISAADREALISFLLIQERMKDRAEVHKVNEFLAERPDIFSAILGVQRQICRVIEGLFREDTSLRGSSVAFSEIAILDPADNTVFPSSRFLKIIVHNLGRFMPEVALSNPLTTLAAAAQKGAMAGVFRQRVAVFQPEGENYRLEGFVEMACPAQRAVLSVLSVLADQETRSAKS